MPGNVVCMGALCKCDQGVAPTPLTVNSQMISRVNGLLVATVMDCKPMANILPFGICQQLTKLASGVPQPCVPAPAGPWTPGSTTDKITKLPILTADSKLMCGVGGQITIADPMCALDFKVK